MIARVALSLAWSAALALLAYPAQAQIIGQQSGILGGEDGFLKVTAAAADTVTLDAMPYERTVTCSDYTVTGTFTGTAPTTWTASPSGDSGACSDTGGGTFSCVVDVAPDASGEGVETITIGDQTVTIGFYVDGEHSCFLSQSVDGAYNSTLSDLDAVATWVNGGSSALDVTQATGTAQPTFRTSIVGGQPAVRCDGGDRMAASTASDWNFMMTAADKTVEHVVNPTLANPAQNSMLTAIGTSVSTVNQWWIAHGDLTTNERYIARTLNAAGANVLALDGTANQWPVQKFSLASTVYDDNGGAGDDAFAFVNGATGPTAAAAAAYGTTAATALNLCAFSNGANFFTGDLFRVLIYQSALTATQRGINKAVDEWALGGTLPVTP